ncbi:C40 family peptidase [Parageobacillus toebii]|uniref:C40 family peptidase n=1 Tax=Parageobacillus toebii TaxID=153151 RepID=UPI0007895FD5|nr:C40 family peptidase [Parageobacillus toebii]
MRRQLALALLLSGSVFVMSDHAEAAEASVNYDQIVPAAKQYVGVPYRWGGTTANGFDCSGFIQHVYQSIGIDMPRTTADMYRMGKQVEKGDLRVGDLVFFNTNGKGVSHAGIYIGNNRFIHASSSKGVIISSLNDPYYWSKTYVGARRVLAYRLAPGRFQDVSPSHWAFDEVRTLSEQELVIGYEDSYFKPNEPITRAEVAAYLAEYLDLNLSDRSVTFKDVPSGYWALGAIRAIQKEGIMNGSNGEFRPEETLTRAQLAAVLTRAFRLQPPTTMNPFTDVPPSFWAYRDIQALAASGITTGRSDGSFGPNEPVTRVQFAAFLYRAMNQ